MVKLNVHEAKTHLSRYLDRVEAGETIILCRHNRPIAEVRPIREQPPLRSRSAGIDRGSFSVPKEFFAPLPADVLSGFEADSE